MAIDVVDQFFTEIWVAAGLSASFPRMNTETGYDGSSSSSILGAMSDADMAKWLKRNALAHAMLGYQKMCFYRHDKTPSETYGLIGVPSTSTTISSALDFINTNLCGQTLQTVALLTDGRIKVTTGASSFYI